jgi:hypothetical protein
MNNSEFIFEWLLRDSEFMTTIDDYISNTIFITRTFDAKDVPQLVLVLMLLLKERTIDVEKNIKDNTELTELLEIFYKYILDRINDNTNIIEFKRDEFKISYDICCRLAVLKLKFSNKTALFCIGKK